MRPQVVAGTSRNQLGTAPKNAAVPVASPPLGGGDEPNVGNHGTVHTTARKLTDEQAAEIRYRVGMGRISQRRAALLYGVSKRTIAGIMAGTLYKRVITPRFEIVAVQPRPTAFEQQAGRRYSLAPERGSAA